MAKHFCIMEGLSEEQTKRIWEVALVHDIGKLFVPATILKSAKPLDEKMRRKINRHPKNGASLVGGLLHVKKFVPGILNHHERWDGCGYPCGTKASDIPYEARLIAVFDSIDAMCGFRYYRKPISTADCKQEVLRCAGTQFDPQIVKNIVSHWEELVTPCY